MLEIGLLIGRDRGQNRFPGRADGGAACAEAAPGRQDVVRHLERAIGPVQAVARRRQLSRAEGIGMGFMRAGEMGRAETDDGPAGDQRRARIGLGGQGGVGNGGGVMPIDLLDMPAIGGEARAGIVGKGEAGRAVDRNAVIVIIDDQLAEAQMTGQRGGFMADTFFHVAVAGDDIGVVVDQTVEADAQMGLGDRHADRGGEALAQRPGGGFDAGSDIVFRMAGGAAAGLAELLQRLQRHRLIAGQIVQRIEQHRTMARRQDEAVAIGPGRIGRVELEKLAVEHGRDIGHAHRQAGVTGIRLFDPLKGEKAKRICQSVMRYAAFRRDILCHGSVPSVRVGR